MKALPFAAAVLCLVTGCGPNETTTTDGRVHVATGTYTEAQQLIDENGLPLIAAVREDGARTFEMMAFDGSARCATEPLLGNQLSVQSSASYVANPGVALRVALLDGDGDFGELRIIDRNCAEVMPRLSNVRLTVARVTGLGLSTSMWIAETNTHELHVLNPWTATDEVIATDVQWRQEFGSTIWIVAHGQLFSWNPGFGTSTPIGSAITEAAIGLNFSFSFVIAFIENGEVFVVHPYDTDASPIRVTSSGDVCDLEFIHGQMSAFAWKSPCADARVVIQSLEAPDEIQPIILDGPVRDVILGESNLLWVEGAEGEAPTLWTSTLADPAASRVRIGPGDRLSSVYTVSGTQDFGPTAPLFVTLDNLEGGRDWGIWTRDDGFSPIEHNVGDVLHFVVDMARANAVFSLVPYNVRGETADLHVYTSLLSTPVGAATDVRIGSVQTPFESRAVTYLQSWNETTHTGDIAAVGYDGEPLELERGVSMYTSLSMPIPALLYTISHGDRQGVWLWIGGGPRD